MVDVPPVRLGAWMPGSASMTLSGSVDFTFSTAFTHMLKPTKMRFHRVVGGALVVLDEGVPVLDERGIQGRLDRFQSSFQAARWPSSGLVSSPASSSSPTENATTGICVALMPWLPNSL